MSKHKTKHQKRVEEFMLAAGQDIPRMPFIPSDEVLQLRAKLMMEEVFETVTRGLGMRVTTTLEDGRTVEVDFAKLVFTPAKEPNILEIVDGCADVSVVTIGTLSACGVGDKTVLKEVDESNLRKFGPGGYRSDGSDGNPLGKWIKPKDWLPPNLPAVLDQQTNDASKSSK